MGRISPFAGLASLCALLAALGGCGGGQRRDRPSILLVVLDTTRVDAVSAYGQVAGTTPAVDALARAGLRYTHAYAQAPWTLPSHATIFTGLLPSQHGVGWHQTRASDDLVTVAERLAAAGYETAGFSENPWISPTFNMAQGFETFTEAKGGGPDIAAAVQAWAKKPHTGRPFFLFVNILDAHAPYSVRRENPYLPAGVSAERARAVSQKPEYYFCSHTPHERELAILRGLYLGDVRAADAKLARVLAALGRAGLRRNLVTIVTADHGEHFGEHRLVGHQFSLREPLIHVPLIVHGLPDTEPAVIETPVALADIAPSILRWAGVAAGRTTAGRPLPTSRDEGDAARVIVAEHDDPEGHHEPDKSPIARYVRALARAIRRQCEASDRVFGYIRAAVQYPFKLVWYSRYPAELYDLGSDPDERHDVAAVRPDQVAALEATLARESGGGVRRPRGASPAAAAPARGVLERLRALGYIGEGAAQKGRPRR